MRPSSYNILVNLENEKKQYALINSYTGTIDLISENVADYLKLIKNASISQESEIKLIERGYVTTLNKKEEENLVRKIALDIHNNSLTKYNFHFIISYDCNLRCKYCYEDDILNYNSNTQTKSIAFELIDKAFETIKGEHNKKQSSGIISLYGGEPFLKENFESVRYITKKSLEINHRISVTTNGYDLDEYFDLIKENDIFSFQITIDGVEDIHNERKPHKTKNNSFQKITDNIDALLKLGSHIDVRINTDKYTFSRIEELNHFFEQKGWFDFNNFSPYLSLLRSEIEYSVINEKKV